MFLIKILATRDGGWEALEKLLKELKPILPKSFKRYAVSKYKSIEIRLDLTCCSSPQN